MPFLNCPVGNHRHLPVKVFLEAPGGKFWGIADTNRVNGIITLRKHLICRIGQWSSQAKSGSKGPWVANYQQTLGPRVIRSSTGEHEISNCTSLIDNTRRGQEGKKKKGSAIEIYFVEIGTGEREHVTTKSPSNRKMIQKNNNIIIFNQNTSNKLPYFPANTAISHLPTDVHVVVEGLPQIQDQLLQPSSPCHL